MNRTTVTVATCEEAERRALKDFAGVRGKIIQAKQVHGYRECYSVSIHCDPPAMVTVVSTDHNDILHWNGDFLDPYWDVQLFSPHPALTGVESLWVDGPSYEIQWDETIVAKIADTGRGDHLAAIDLANAAPELLYVVERVRSGNTDITELEELAALAMRRLSVNALALAVQPKA